LAAELWPKTILKLAVLHVKFYGSNNGFFEKFMHGLSIGRQWTSLALNCLVFEKIAFLCTHFGDTQTDTWRASLHKGDFAIATGGSINSA